jgi:hypothetical protein
MGGGVNRGAGAVECQYRGHGRGEGNSLASDPIVNTKVDQSVRAQHETPAMETNGDRSDAPPRGTAFNMEGVTR